VFPLPKLRSSIAVRSVSIESEHRRRIAGIWMWRVGVTLLGVGFAIVAAVGGFISFTGYRQHQAQAALGSELVRTWASSPTGASLAVSKVLRPAFGRPMMVLRIPEIGLRQVVLEGVSTSDLERGPGHYPGTALPGQLGNVAIAGHRVTYGGPFRNLDRLLPGDEIDIDTRDRTYIYRVRSAQEVTPSDIGVTFAVPEQPEGRPTQRLLTLTTCTPPYSTARRLIVLAELSRVN
jgi:sortase A